MNQVYTVLMLVFVGLALTAQTAFATNESSYKIGLKYGHDEYLKCDTPQSCNVYTDYPLIKCQDSPHVDNVTACTDGYVYAFSRTCWAAGQDCIVTTPAGKTIEKNPAAHAACIAAGHDWLNGRCLTYATIAGSTGPSVTTCRHGSCSVTSSIGCVAGTPGCNVTTTNDNVSKGNATGNQSQTNATMTGNLTEPTATTTNEHSATPYDSGYSHGCSDAKISNVSEGYIHRGGGPTSHTYSFMQGYYNGYNACSVSSPPAQQPSSPNNSTSSASYNGTLVATSGPSHCYREGRNHICEASIGCEMPKCGSTNVTNTNESKTNPYYNMTEPPTPKPLISVINANGYTSWFVDKDGHTRLCVVPDSIWWGNSEQGFDVADCFSEHNSGLRGVYVWSNDPSFQFGFKQAGYAMDSWFRTPDDKDPTLPYYNQSIDICNKPNDNDFYIHGKVIVANATSCIEGYVQGFRHWCDTNTESCISATQYGMVPIQLLTDERYHDKP